MTWINLIGKDIKIIESKNPNMKNLSGKVILESKNMLVVKTSNGVKKIPKDIVKIYINNRVIDGKTIKFRPIDRISRR